LPVVSRLRPRFLRMDDPLCGDGRLDLRFVWTGAAEFGGRVGRLVRAGAGSGGADVVDESDEHRCSANLYRWPVQLLHVGPSSGGVARCPVSVRIDIADGVPIYSGSSASPLSRPIDW